MKVAGDFLAKFNRLTPPHDVLRSAVQRAIETVMGVKIVKGIVRIQNSVAFIDCSSILKNKIRVDRVAILDDVYERVPKARELLRDIR